jgi:myo-inositol 2-dehydrogenase / D-chiro-inositol 1-dehydrogenase
MSTTPRAGGIRVGVIGAGIMGADHVATLHRYVSGATVIAVADIDVKRASCVAASVPGAWATSTPAN